MIQTMEPLGGFWHEPKVLEGIYDLILFVLELAKG
jgi:hypothetical protein